MNSLHQANALTLTLQALADCSEEELVAEVNDQEVETLGSLLSVPHMPLALQLLRTGVADTLAALPPAAYRPLTTLAKRLRTPSRKIKAHQPESLRGNALMCRLAREHGFRSWADGKTYSLVLCHDVDTKAGYAFVPRLVDELAARDLRSSFYFVTGGEYEVDQAVATRLMSQGFEIGLHGLTHDLAIAWRSRRRIRDWLERGRDRLGIQPDGFRSPGLAISRVLLEEVARAGFKYDSSMQFGSTFHHSTEFGYPFWTGIDHLLEVPVWFQDCFLFRDASLSADEAMRWCAQAVRQLSAHHGVLVFLMHPDNMVHQQDFMKRFLDFAASEAESNALVCPLTEVARRFTMMEDQHVEAAP